MVLAMEDHDAPLERLPLVAPVGVGRHDGAHQPNGGEPVDDLAERLVTLDRRRDVLERPGAQRSVERAQVLILGAGVRRVATWTKGGLARRAGDPALASQ